jgi:hypothetical protein
VRLSAARLSPGVPLDVEHRDHDHRNNHPANLVAFAGPCDAKAP